MAGLAELGETWDSPRMQLPWKLITEDSVYWWPVVSCCWSKRVEFEWDPAKSDANVDKHRIDFQDAVREFAD